MQGFGLISNSYHFFPIQLAIVVGERRAIILSNIQYWIEKNRANGKNFHDGRYWTYNSTKAFTGIFPYLTQRKIEHALNALQKEGYLLTGNYNKAKYDRTCWYALGDKAIPYFYLSNTAETLISHNSEMDMTKTSNGFTESVEPIPDINTDNKPDNKHYGISDAEVAEIVEIWNSIIGVPNIRSMTKTSSRFKALNARFKDHGYDVLMEMLLKVRDSDFLRGKNKEGWTPNFDWVVNPTNFIKIIEDTYINKEGINERSGNNNPKGESYKEFATELSNRVDKNKHLLDELPEDYVF